MQKKCQKNIIFIETKKYSSFFKLVFKEYCKDIVVEIDDQTYSEKDINCLISEWCANKNICATTDFSLRKGKEVLFSFHDHPDQLMGAVSEINFLENLVDNRIIKIKYPVNWLSENK